MPDKRTIATWTATAVLAFVFLGAGVTKLLGQEIHLANFERWGYPAWFVYVVGTVETLAGLALLWPRAAFYGGAALVGDMLGATGTHIVHAEWAFVPVTLALGALAAYVAYQRRPAYVERRIHPRHAHH